MTKVLIVADRTDAIDALARTLETNGCEVAQRAHGPTHDLSRDRAAELQELQQAAWSVLITDARDVPEESALARIPRIVVTTGGTIPEAVQAIRAGAIDYLPIPVDDDTLMASVEQASLQSQNELPGRVRQGEVSIVGESPAILEVRERIERLAATDTPVLIQGEPGTGKELTARAIHAASARRLQPLITVNCGAIPTELLEAELFGRASDSPQGHATRGLVDSADGGTLFLDEIGELSAEVQARLLRLLQTGEIRPVGSAVAHSTNVRVVAATHRDLQAMVDAGQFREDLFYRLNVLMLHVPPLRDRGGDIALLADWMLRRTAKRLGRSVERFSSEALQALVSYNWPGNVRELANAVERAVILAEAPEISSELLAIQQEGTPAPVLPEGQDQTTLEDYFVRFVLENEEHCTETELAEKLGISRKSLWERRQRLNIPRRRTKKRTPRRAEIGSEESVS